ncbi:predicted protein [Nematostella vectensis]|uniref:[histone H3]-dimethyl-L-lysine(9) demethylase n=1 Tax=Nematostella vectensis TaxID=45351 RepID=A7S7K1_NEMVE|nr:predicted protein [Nematostella vectensis]|eukprot:XP_001632408.1 predicted protein [Nematostella vectensis]
MFRRLKRKKRSGRIHMAGFLMPEHAEPDDFKPWVANADVLSELTKEEAMYILKRVGDEFCSLVQEEKEAKVHASSGVEIAYKRAVLGVREMCDACATTIFNIHWVCQKCGFGVCLDCYELRVQERKEKVENGIGGFEFKWVNCAPGICHFPKNLTIAQIIPRQVLLDLAENLHKTRIKWKISDGCPCHYQPVDDDRTQGLSKESDGLFNTMSTGTQSVLKSSTIMSSPLAIPSVTCISQTSKHPPLTCNQALSTAPSSTPSSVVWTCSASTSSKIESNSVNIPSTLPVGPTPRTEKAESVGSSSGAIDPVEAPTTIAPLVPREPLPEVATSAESTRTETTHMDETSRSAFSDEPVITDEYPAPHSFLCDGRLLRLHEPHHHGNVKCFEKRWIEGKPVLVSHIDKLLDTNLWSPESFGEEFGDELADVVNCRNGVVIENFEVGAFWKGFESIKDRAVDCNNQPMLLKLKDWPPGADFSEKLPSRFKDLMDHIPLPDYTRRDGSRNLVSRLPDFFVKPDLGPKMYNAYGSASFPKEGTTNLHIDMSDAVNVMVYVGVPRDEGAGEREKRDAIKAVDSACDKIQQQRVRRDTARIGALWHIYHVEDADKIRDLLHKVAREKKMKYAAHHDPIHDQCFYLDHEIRERLKREYNVEGYAICQCLGDGVFIPAGAPHQVRNLYSCVKIAEDFVSPERIGHCFKTTQEFRHLSDKHTNHEDKLQVKNIIYHAVKDAVYVLENSVQDMKKDKEESTKS